MEAIDMTYLWQSHLSGTSGDLDPIYHQKPRTEILPYIDWTPRKVLDVGCGGGATGRLLMDRYPGCEAYGIELNAEAATFARQTYRHVSNIDIESAFSAAEVPFSEIDTVLLLDVLEHLYNPWKVLEDLHKYLPPDCRVIASIPNAFNIQLLEELASGEWRYDKWGLLDITHIRFFTEAGMRELFEQTGFGITRTGNIPHPESMLPSPIQFGEGILETTHAIVKAVDEQTREELLSIQKIIVATCEQSSTQSSLDRRRSHISPPAQLAPGLGRSYLNLIRRCILGLIYDDPGMAFNSNGTSPFSPDVRERGLDWPSVAHSMIGNKRMLNLQTLAEHVLRRRIPGDLIETGVWRGGACIMMRAVLKAYGITDRKIWVADSFEGLPPPDPTHYPADAGDTHFTFKALAVSLEQVQQNFERYGLLDEQIMFLKGWFRDTLPTAPIGRLALMRLDGDMYESTMDALSNLFPKLAPGGFVIIDDYGYIDSCRQAVHDYRNANGITDPIYDIDGTGVFWQNLKPNRFSIGVPAAEQLEFEHGAQPIPDAPRPAPLAQQPSATPAQAQAQAAGDVADRTDTPVSPSPEAASPEHEEHTRRVTEAANLCGTGDLAAAADILIELVNANTQVWEAYNDLGAIAIRQGDVETAEQLLRRGIELEPVPGKATLSLAVLQAVDDRPEEALETLSPLLRHDPDHFEALDLIRQLLGKLGPLSPVAWARLRTDLRGKTN